MAGTLIVDLIGVPRAFYFQSADPAVANPTHLRTGINWIDTTSSPYVWKRRNAANDGWDTLGKVRTDAEFNTDVDARITTVTPADHATEHQNGGGDEISVTGLSGLLADAQTPLAHKASHENGGSDELSVAGLSGVLADPQVAGAVRETGGPTVLTVGAVADGEFVKRVGTDLVGATPGGGSGLGDFVGPSSSVDSELVLFDGTTGKLGKRATGSGLVKATSGVYSTVTAPSGAVVGDTDAQTLTNKTLTSPTVNTPTITSPQASLTAAHGSDDTYTGTTIKGLNAGATIAQWEIVYLGGSSTWLLADANGSGTYPARGLAVAAYVNTDPATILVLGTVRNDAWNWTPGATIYLSATAGGLTQTAPSTSGDKVQQVGFALTADIAFFDFNSTYLTVT